MAAIRGLGKQITQVSLRGWMSQGVFRLLLGPELRQHRRRGGRRT